jgi:hypothetical protein
MIIVVRLFDRDRMRSWQNPVNKWNSVQSLLKNFQEKTICQECTGIMFNVDPVYLHLTNDIKSIIIFLSHFIHLINILITGADIYFIINSYGN